MLRLVLVFIHVCSAMGVFGAAAIEGASLLHLSRSGGTSVAFQGFGLARRVGSLSFGLILLSGILLTQFVWGWQSAWISVSMSSIVAMAIIGATVTRRAMARLCGTSDSGGAYEALVSSFFTRVGILIGIVFLMTVKPPLIESLIAIGVASLGGLSAGFPAGRRVSRAASHG